MVVGKFLDLIFLHHFPAIFHCISSRRRISIALKKYSFHIFPTERESQRIQLISLVLPIPRHLWRIFRGTEFTTFRFRWGRRAGGGCFRTEPNTNKPIELESITDKKGRTSFHTICDCCPVDDVASDMNRRRGDNSRFVFGGSFTTTEKRGGFKFEFSSQPEKRDRVPSGWRTLSEREEIASLGNRCLLRLRGVHREERMNSRGAQYGHDCKLKIDSF